MKVLLADDDKRIRAVVSDFLLLEGYEVIEVEDGREAISAFQYDKTIELFILDVMMPFVNGFEVCKEIRKSSSVPVIILTAKSDESDEIEGFTSGADEYVSKPFKASLLVARVNALYNRVYGTVETNYILKGMIKVIVSKCEVEIDGKAVKLSNVEFKLLSYLMRNEDIVLSREKLLDRVWGYDFEGSDRTVDTAITRLRSKIEPANVYIKSVPKRGYKFKVIEVQNEID